MLSDDALLEIFNFYVEENMDNNLKQRMEGWITLAHVCRRWRSVVFQSPLRLKVQLVCIPKTPTRDILDIWPPLPLIIRDFDDYRSVKPYVEDNIIAALERNDRVCQIQLKRRELGYFTNSGAILKPFTELTVLVLQLGELADLGPSADEEPKPILPPSFLGGFAPRLRSLILVHVPFQGLPKLLLSVAHLVHLSLRNIPRSGYIPPEVMAASLSTLTSLEYLCLYFLYLRYRPALETRRPPPLTRSILPNLTTIKFKGTSEYLEAILTRIDAPRLEQLRITFFNQLIFNTPQLFQFISRRPTLMAREKGYISFKSKAIIVRFTSHLPDNNVDVFSVGIRCRASEWQLHSLEQVCSLSLPHLSTLEDLYIFEDRYERPVWQNDVENMQWLDLLLSFIALRNLYISEEFVPRIAPALRELVGGRTTEVLPVLENIFLERLSRSVEDIEGFITARRLNGRPVMVSRWDRWTDF